VSIAGFAIARSEHLPDFRPVTSYVDHEVTEQAPAICRAREDCVDIGLAGKTAPSP
jgi:hypothetical protein